MTDTNYSGKDNKSKSKVKHFLIDMLFCMGSCAVGAAAIQYIMIPCGLTTGGVTGIVRIVMQVTGMDFSLLYYIFSGVIVLITWLTLGFKQVRRVLIMFVMFPAFTWIFGHFDIQLISSGDKLLGAIFYGIFSGISSSLIFYRGYTYAGTDGLAKVIRKKWLPQMAQSKIMVALDVIVIIASAFIYGTEIALYAIINELVISETINVVLYGFSSKIVQLQIITEKPDKIEHFIINNLHRGLSMHDVIGGYTHQVRTEFRLLCSPRESLDLKKELIELDPDAFVTIIRVDGVWGAGKGFSKITDEEADQ
jgi:Uncharacterized conserved protein